MASKHKEGLNVKEKVSGGKRAMSENSAIIKIITNHTREMEELREKYMHVMKELSNLINEHVDLKLLYDHVRKENKQLKEQVENNRLAINIIDNLTYPKENREVLRELGNNLENEPKLIQSYKDIIEKLDGKDSGGEK